MKSKRDILKFADIETKGVFHNEVTIVMSKYSIRLTCRTDQRYD